MSQLPSLTIVIATLGDQVKALVLPDAAPDLDYLVCVQQDTGIRPEWTKRPDVRLMPLSSIGLSRNRNAGLAAAEGALVLFCDDDIQLCPSGIDQLRATFVSDETLALSIGWRKGTCPTKGRRAGPYALTRFNTGHACVPAIMIRRFDIIQSGITFDPDFGVGAPYPLGEDYIFVTDILSAGFKGRGFPIEVGAHPHASSGDNWRCPDLMRARQKVLKRVFGHWHAGLRIIYALKHRRRFNSPLHALHFALGR